MNSRGLPQSLQTSSLPDVLERVLDKGIILAGDIKVNLVDIELLSLQIRLVICSVDKAREMGMDWWVGHPAFSSRGQAALPATALSRIEERLARLESMQRKVPAEIEEESVCG